MSEKSVKRWSAKRKQEVVLRLLRGEGLDTLSRETGQPASVLSRWREEFLEGGMAALKRRTDDPKVNALEKELRRAKRLVGELMMDKELLEGVRVPPQAGTEEHSAGTEEAGLCSLWRCHRWAGAIEAPARSASGSALPEGPSAKRSAARSSMQQHGVGHAAGSIWVGSAVTQLVYRILS